MNSQKPLRVVVAGLGNMGRSHALAYATNPGFEIAGLVNRFRWEDRDQARKQGRPFERVRSLLSISSVMAVKSQGIDRSDKDQILSILALVWAEGAEGAGILTLVLAGDGAVALEVEALEIALEDVSKPYLATSRHVPDHGV